MLTVRYWAAARAAAGTEAELVPGGRPLAVVIAELSALHGERLAAVLARSSFLCDGEQWHRTNTELLPPDGQLDVLPPFAGG